MSQGMFKIVDGKIMGCSQNVSLIKREYFEFCPRNFLETSDLLKKLSYLCDGVYVQFLGDGMEIFLFRRDSLDLFTKLKLTPVETCVPLNELLQNFFLQSMNE